MQSSAEPFITWYLTDGKPGHENQSSGLLNALARYVPLQAHGIPVSSGPGTIGWWALKIFPPAKDLPNPHLIIGAGHGTHIPLLAARRARGGRTVVLMRPSLPFSWYDLCLIPEHDGIEAEANVVLTRGVLNKIASGGIHEPSRGLILLGGPSRHYNWDPQSILWQVQSLLKQEKKTYQWVLSTSRRTPPSMLTALRNLQFPNLQVFAGETTPPGWVTEQLALAGRVWVSEDSVSMVYEALTCGAAVGVLNVPCKAWGRVVRGLDSLAEKGIVTTFTAWRQGQKLVPPRQQFNEADRCAQILVERWFSSP
ncbi:mitochondrial fission ELM1 family protein [Nitrosococcus oceani]|uniref:mitochondrial fission ELM1 family protein n=1 Tax=Nitrosococcus oceani TaxID=1229 RepID=UPI0004E8657C|nr:mitochondrial fission ELM1 family protein [Nitrosococcus oceani]KFI23597.1 nucleoside-diphosphate sugar epimerase [Nitrosococcus oceani]